MNTEILVAVLSFVGTLLGTAGGIVASAKLTDYRLCQLEKKVDSLNDFSQKIPLIEEKIRVGENRINIIERNGIYEQGNRRKQTSGRDRLERGKAIGN